jgi:signal transduction histidine kinase
MAHQTSSEITTHGILELITVLSQEADEQALVKIIGEHISHQKPSILCLSYLNIDKNSAEGEIVALLEPGSTSQASDSPLLLPSKISLGEPWTITPNQPAFIKDLTTGSYKQTLLNKLIPEQAAKSAVLLPLYCNSRWQALIAIAWLDGHTFTNKEKAFYTTLTRPLASIIANRRVYRAEEAAHHASEQRARELETVMKVSAVVAKILNLDELLQTVCDLTKTNFDLYHVNIYLLSENGQNMVLAAGAGETGKLMKSRRYSVPITRQRSLLALAAQRREVVIVDDVTKSPDFLPNPFLPHTRSEMVVPVIVGSTLVGALVVQSRQVKRFDDADIPVITALSDQIAIAVQNARLFAEQERIVEELRALDKLKSQFMANMSHELRTPLNSILNFTEFVSTGVFGPVNERQVEALNKSIASGEHLLSLINDILDLTKIESGMMELFVEEIDLRALVEDVANLAEGLPKNKSVQFICDVAESLPTISGDRRRIQQILLNLVSNAIKFTTEGSVKLSAVLENGEMHFSVRDTGPGIAPEDQSLIFQSFRQTKQGLQKGSGTGLGLPISRHLAEAHGGKLWLESELGAGSCFHVTLPIEYKAIPVTQ